MERLAREGQCEVSRCTLRREALSRQRCGRAKIKDASAGLVTAPWEMDKENMGGRGWSELSASRNARARAPRGVARGRQAGFLDIGQTGLEATLLGAIFDVDHNSNADLSSLERARGGRAGRLRWTGVLADTIETAECRADDGAAVFVSLEA